MLSIKEYQKLRNNTKTLFFPPLSCILKKKTLYFYNYFFFYVSSMLKNTRCMKKTTFLMNHVREKNESNKENGWEQQRLMSRSNDCIFIFMTFHQDPKIFIKFFIFLRISLEIKLAYRFNLIQILFKMAQFIDFVMKLQKYIARTPRSTSWMVALVQWTKWNIVRIKILES